MAYTRNLVKGAGRVHLYAKNYDATMLLDK